MRARARKAELERAMRLREEEGQRRLARRKRADYAARKREVGRLQRYAHDQARAGTVKEARTVRSRAERKREEQQEWEREKSVHEARLKEDHDWTPQSDGIPGGLFVPNLAPGEFACPVPGQGGHDERKDAGMPDLSTGVRGRGSELAF